MNFKVFTNWLFTTKSLINAKLLSYMIIGADEEHRIDFSTSKRKQLALRLQIDDTGLSRAIRQLLDAGIIKKACFKGSDGNLYQEKSVYIIHPSLFSD